MKRLHYDQKYTVPILLTAWAIMLVVGGFLVLRHPSAPAKSKSQAAYHPATTSQEAITRGEQWFSQNTRSTQPFQRLMLDYLQRKFGLDKRFSVAANPIAAPTGEPDKSEYQAIRRIVEPNKLVDVLPTNTDALQQQIMAAANCDHIPLPSDYDDQLVTDIKAGGYELTHVILMLDFMTDNGCTLPAKTLARRPQAYQTMADIANDANRKPDLRYEAMAFLLGDNQRDLVKPASVQWIVTSQRRDGGWPNTGTKDDPSNDHPTLLALWALLEYTHPNVAAQPIIRRPN